MVEKLLKESSRKVCEYDFGDYNDVMHDFMYMMEKSSFCCSLFVAGLLRVYNENEALINRDLEKESVKPG